MGVHEPHRGHDLLEVACAHRAPAPGLILRVPFAADHEKQPQYVQPHGRQPSPAAFPHLPAKFVRDGQSFFAHLLRRDARAVLRRGREQAQPRHPVEHLLPDEIRQKLEHELPRPLRARAPAVRLPRAAEPHLTRVDRNHYVLEMPLLLTAQQHSHFEGLVHVGPQRSRKAVLHDTPVKRPGWRQMKLFDPC